MCADFEIVFDSISQREVHEHATYLAYIAGVCTGYFSKKRKKKYIYMVEKLGILATISYVLS